MNNTEIYFDSTNQKEEVLSQFIRLIRQQQAKFDIGLSGESGYYILKDAFTRGIISEQLYYDLHIVLIDMNTEVRLTSTPIITKVNILGKNFTKLETSGITYHFMDLPEFNDPKAKHNEI